MTESDTAVRDDLVTIRFKATGALGVCAPNAVEFWESRGFEVVAADEVAKLAQEKAEEALSLFDPAGEGVNAKTVHDYLTGLDRATVEGSAEYDRVVAAEKAGQNRSTALPTD